MASVTVEAEVSPFAAAYESQYQSNNCYDTDPTATVVSLTEIRIDGNCIHDYTLLRSWSATDCAGYESTHEQTVTVIDNVAPTLELPVDLALSCDVADSTPFGIAASTVACCDSTIIVVAAFVSCTCPRTDAILPVFTAPLHCFHSSLCTV